MVLIRMTLQRGKMKNETVGNERIVFYAFI